MYHTFFVNATNLVGSVKMSVGWIWTGPDPFFSLPNDKEKKVVWQKNYREFINSRVKKKHKWFLILINWKRSTITTCGD